MSSEHEAGHPRPSILLAITSLGRRELVRFFRQRNRVVGSLATPLVFWMLFGWGLGPSFQPAGLPPGTDALAYFFPGTLVMILLFTAIFSTISVIEDRREGFLQSVLVAPIPREAVVLGKVAGGGTIAAIQGILFLLLGALSGMTAQSVSIPLALLAIGLMAVGLTALGLCIAWRMDSTQGFHAVMNLFLMPMWLLSGALFPAEGLPLGLRAVMAANPLTYGLGLLRHALGTAGTDLPGEGTCLAVTALFTLGILALASAMVRCRRKIGET